MPEKERLFFTIDDACIDDASAVCNAFAQYPFPLNLLSVIWSMVFGDEAYVLHHSGSRIVWAMGIVWAKIPGTPKLIPSSEADLKQRIVGQLKRYPPEPGGLARICSRVIHQILELCDRGYQYCRSKFSSRKEYWNAYGFRLMLFRDFEHLLRNVAEEHRRRVDIPGSG